MRYFGPEQVIQVMHNLGDLDITEHHVKDMIAEIDINGDEQIDFTDFVRLMCTPLPQLG